MKRKSRKSVSAKAPKKRDGKKDTTPLFIELDKSGDDSRLVAFVVQVMDSSGLVFHQPAQLIRAITKKVRESGATLFTAQTVLSLLAEEGGTEDRPKTPEGLPMPDFNENASLVLARRYLIKDAKGNPTEQPWQMLERVAWAIAAAERKYDPRADVDAIARRFYEMMARLEFLPNSPTLMNAGRELGQLSACFVLPVGDSMESIFEAIKHTALIHKSGGGTGFSFSRLRPSNDIVKSTKGVSSGPISFMTVFDAATDTIKQGGTRRGANMGILRVDHPDILEFITCKRDLAKLNNFNLSVAVTDEFMGAVKNDQEFRLINPRTGKPHRRLAARLVFDLIVQHAWSNGEPGLVFLDRINVTNPTPEVGEVEATNPCGEQPLLPYESCNLGSINMSRMVENGEIQWDKLRETAHLAVRFLDDVIDVNKYPLPEIEEQTLGNRKIGLGVMGFAEMLIMLGIAYDSKKGLEKGREVMAFMQKEGHKASCELARTRGSFPNIDKSIFKDAPEGKRPRNATVTTVAPTGTLSILAGTSSGVEPLFALSFSRNVLDGATLVEVNPLFVKEMADRGLNDATLMQKIAETGGIRKLKELPEDLRRVFVTAHDITPEWHVRMQAAFQEFTDNAVSKTVNFPEDASPEQVAETYRLAYDLGCKGITIFRYGSRKPVLSLPENGKNDSPGKKESPSDKLIAQTARYNELRPRERPSKLQGSTELQPIGCGKLYITINSDHFGLCELFTSTGRTGGCPSQSEAISRLVSLALRTGIAVDEITHQLQGIRCHSAVRRNELVKNGTRAVSCPAAIGQTLVAAAKKFEDSPLKTKTKNNPINAGADPDALQTHRLEADWLKRGLCPDCETPIEREGGCLVCRSCGFSKCG